MAWQKYELLFRLQSPLHIGYRKVGNLMQTRGYVPGRNLWAALTARLTREYGDGAKGACYQKIGTRVKNNFRFTYLYPALLKDPAKKPQSIRDLTIHYPWDEYFDYLFLDSYASTALNYDHQAAEAGLLHETEFIAPYTREGQPVYLTGNLYTQTDLPELLDNWKNVLDKLQFGGERGYGWGRVKLISNNQKSVNAEPPAQLTEDNKITAHLKAEKVTGVIGPVEPLIGWERNNDKNGKSKWRLSKQAVICYAPGAVVLEETTFTIDADGHWN